MTKEQETLDSLTIRIKRIQKEKGISNVELAKRLDISAIGIGKIINGSPTVKSLIKIAEVLECDLSDFFTDTHHEHNTESLFCPKCGAKLNISLSCDMH